MCRTIYESFFAELCRKLLRIGFGFSINTAVRHGEFPKTTQMPPQATSSLKACKWQINSCPGTYLSRGIKNHERTCPFRSENIIQADPGLDLDVSGIILYGLSPY